MKINYTGDTWLARFGAAFNTEDLALDADLDLDDTPSTQPTATQALRETAPAPAATPQSGDPGASKTPPAASGTPAKGASLLPDSGASLFDDDDAGSGTPEPTNSGPPDPEAGATDPAKPATGEPAADAAEAAKVGTKGDWRTPIYDKLAKQVEAKLKNSVTAAQYDAAYKKATDRIKSELGRYKTQEDYMIAGWNAQQRIRSGELAPKALAKDATPQEVAAWRKAQGIPEKAEAYDIPKVPGHDWQEHDAPVLNSFKGVAHKANLTQAQVADVSTWYAQELQKAYKQRDESLSQIDREDKIRTEEALRNDPDIGNAEYRPTLALVKRLLGDREVFTENAAKKMMRARDAQGHLIINDPDVVKHLRSVAVSRYGGADLEVRNQETQSRLNSRKDEIKKIMNMDINKYYAEGLDREYAKILEEEAGMGGRRR